MLSSYSRLVLDIQNKGLKQDGDEPAIPPQRQKVVCCGDMAFQQKMADQGGPCKRKEFFCIHCECSSGEKDLLSYVSGSDVCDMCVKNE